MNVHSILLYGAPVWAETLSYKITAQSAMLRVQRRMAFRMICAYNIVSYVATGFLVKIPPIDLITNKFRIL